MLTVTDILTSLLSSLYAFFLVSLQRLRLPTTRRLQLQLFNLSKEQEPHLHHVTSPTKKHPLRRLKEEKKKKENKRDIKVEGQQTKREEEVKKTPTARSGSREALSWSIQQTRRP